MINAVHEEFKDLVKAFAEEKGIYLNKMNLSYDETTLNYSITFKSANERDKRYDFRRIALRNGYDPAIYDKTFIDPENGLEYRVSGLNPRARKYPVIIEDNSGKQMKANYSYVLRALEKEGK